MRRPLRIDRSQREDDDPALYTRLVRDVCLLYHRLADYGHIMGDLNYREDYPLCYWELLNRIDTGGSDDRFIRGGILILMLAMIQDVLDGSGNSITDYLQSASRAITEFLPEDDNMLRLVKLVEHGLHLVDTSRVADELFSREVCWAYDAFVRRYFREAAV